MSAQAKDNVVEGRFEKKVEMGVGEAVLRLVHVEFIRSQGISRVPEHLLKERDMIVEALNQHRLDLGFDCTDDGVPDGVGIFRTSSETSCCRIRPPVAVAKATGSRRTPSRKKKPTSRRS